MKNSKYSSVSQEFCPAIGSTALFCDLIILDNTKKTGKIPQFFLTVGADI
jgi:hypothetical protein